MKAFLLGIIVIVGMGESFAQKKQKMIIQSVTDITIDADLVECNTLNIVAEVGFWFFRLGQDASNLYIANRVEKQMLQHLAVRNGVLLTGQSNHRNRDDIQFLFP